MTIKDSPSSVPARIGASAVRSGGVAARATAIGAAWGVIGTSVGTTLAFVYPHSVLALPGFPAGLGALAAALSAIGVLGRYRPSPLAAVATELRHADKLYAGGLLTRREYRALRAEILRRYGHP